MSGIEQNEQGFSPSRRLQCDLYVFFLIVCDRQRNNCHARNATEFVNSRRIFIGVMKEQIIQQEQFCFL